VDGEGISVAVDDVHETASTFVQPLRCGGQEKLGAKVQVALEARLATGRTGDATGRLDAAEGIFHGFGNLRDVGYLIPDALVSHRCGEIAWSDEEDVDIVDLKDFVEVLVGNDVFDENDQQRVVVGQLHVVWYAVPLSTGVVSSPADGRELPAEDDVLRFCGGIDVGDGDRLGSAIECAVDQSLRIFIDPDHRSQTPEVAGARQVTEIGVIDAGMLSLQPYRVDTVCVRDRAKSVDVVGVGEADY